ncbi:TRAP transporter substrate-binding protein [Ramlibacter sp. RBP-2]|uniref:TRAP transporter substrate-binding protein n=1 Tax=Ramlibacter lithotrophicus TaxID=2606681 RepID=A0A7X6DIZ9_9BURK|nr:TRAP transporter substrate-binding protein [Ramlibacter lithotrophicus]NKE67908.1 TRAP transporter substrate-binding protein [Ramlibacter lithotrophicus]
MRIGTFLKSMVFTLAAAGASLPAQAQTTWTMASGYPESSFFTQNIRQFIKEVEDKSGGKLKIDLRSNDSLIKLDAIKRAVQSGQIQIGEIRLGVYGNEAAMYNLDNTPGVAVDYNQAMKLANAQAPFFDNMFKKNGMRLVTMVPWPGQGFYTKQPVNSLADLKGQKLRIYSKQTQQLGDRLGMQALILPFAEVPQAFSTGMIQSLWTSAQTGVDVKAWENVKHFTYTGTMHNKNAIIVNERALRQLDANLQKIVLDAGNAATLRGFEMSKKASADREQTLKENGMVIAQAPKDVLAKMDEIGKDMIAEWLATATPDEKAVYETYRSSLK